LQAQLVVPPAPIRPPLRTCTYDWKTARGLRFGFRDFADTKSPCSCLSPSAGPLIGMCQSRRSSCARLSDFRSLNSDSRR